ncbi:MAG: response regulator [Ruminiclostridium sp.]|nr:response regulator [Ruminiclostridium sp.]
MEKRNLSAYDSDKDTARVRRHAERSTYVLSVAYLIVMFFMTRIIHFPLWASLCYPGVFVIGSFLFFCKKIPRSIYQYWFAASSAGLCALFAVCSDTFTIPLLIYITTHCLTAMFRNERLILVDTILGITLSTICYFINLDNPVITDSIESISELLLIPACILSTHFALTSLVKRDKQLFLFAQQKNRNNTALLQIVEAKRSEAEAAAKVKTEFLANTSHEIRTPMNSIMGMTELALREDISPQVRNYLGNIRDAGTNLLNIINDILDFSKIESGKVELNLTDYNILSVINDICNIISVRINSEVVQIVTCIDPSVPTVMTGDERRIKQIVLNLAGNAIKYTRHGSITISVSAETKSADMVMLKFSVKDTGIGIKQADIYRLFNEFERADTKRNRNIEGTGLGLAICKSLTEMMGGTIKVSSVYGAGSIFTVEIPQRVKNAESCINIENREEKYILICIPDKEQLKAVSAEIKSLGIEFKSVTNHELLEKREFEKCTDIIIDCEEYCDGKERLSPYKDKLTVIIDPGVHPECAPEIRRIYRPVTIISLLVLFGSHDIATESQPQSRIKRFSAPDAKILIVDDNRANLLVAERLISLYNIQTDTADSGILALKMVQQNDYDIVFMDHMMPELDGIETTQAIRSLGGKYSKLIIVALTANVISGAAEMFRESGLDDFLGKPIEMSELNRILTRFIPEEKRLPENTAAQPEKKEPSQLLLKLKQVEELNSDILVAQCGERADFIRDILLSTIYSPSRTKLDTAFAAKDWRNYTIYVHGLKGALRNIGAEKLGQQAYELEMAGKRNDEKFILANNKDFTTSFDRFAKKIIEITEFGDKKPGEKGDISELLTEMKKIGEAVKDMDYSLCAGILGNICQKHYNRNIDNMLADLTAAVNDFDFDLAKDIVDTIISDIKSAL